MPASEGTAGAKDIAGQGSSVSASTDPDDPHDSTDEKKTAGYWRVTLVAVAYLALVGYFAVTGLQEHVRTSTHAQTRAAATNDQCPPGTAPPAGRPLARLAPRGTQVEVIAFGRDLGSQERLFEFAVTDPSGLLKNAHCLHAQVNPFLRIGQVETAQLDQSRIDAVAGIMGQQTLLTVTMHRDDATFAPSGAYTGTISIVDPRIERVDVPIAVSLAYPVWRLALVVLLLVLPLAIGYLWLLRGSFRGGTNGGPVGLHEFDEYAFSRNGILAIGAGTASAVIVFSATYSSSPSWGGDFPDAIGLFGAMFAAFVATATPVTATGLDRPDKPGQVDTSTEVADRQAAGQGAGT